MSQFDVRYYEETFKQTESNGEHTYAYSGSYIMSGGKKYEMTKLFYAQDKAL